MEQKTLLIIEDDWSVRSGLAAHLSRSGYRVLEADGAEVGLHEFRSKKPDLVILDINLPDGDGREVCRKIRAHPSLAKTPVIMLTAKGKVEEKGEGFQAGADQYLAKPVTPGEAQMWVEALLRRVGYDKEEPELFELGDLTIDVKGHLARWKGEPIQKLTKKEFELFWFLVKNRPRVLSRERILSELWRTVTVDHVVNFHLSGLRRKLPQALADRLQTVPGKGFRFME